MKLVRSIVIHNMLKRITGILLILLANISLLTFEAIPHHHHGEVICFVHQHCDQGHHHYADNPCHNDSSCPATQHDHSSDASCCSLFKWFIVPASQKDDCADQNVAFIDNGHVFQLDGIPSVLEISTLQICLPFRQKPYTNTYLLTYVSCDLGLRAPPFC